MSAWREWVARSVWTAHPAHPGPLYAMLKESQWWSKDELDRYQVRALRRLVAIAAKVPFYADGFRAARVSPTDLQGPADLARLPVLERADLERLGVLGIKVPGSWGMK